MADLSYDAFQKGKLKSNKSNNDLSYSTFLAKKNNVGPSIKERITGAPTKQKDGTYKANTGVLPFLGAVKDVFTSGTKGTGKILGESMAVNTGAFDLLNKANLQAEDIKLNLVKKYNENKRLGKDNTRIANAYNQLSSRPTDTIQSLAPESQSSNLKALGNLGMMATELTGLSSVARTGKAFGYLGKEAEKQALKNITAQELKKRLATEVAFNTGQGYVADVSMRAQNNEKNFKPGLGTALGFGLTGLLGNQQMNRTLNEQSAARIAEKKAQTFPIPEAGTPPPPKLLEAPSIKLPAKGILESQAKLREVPVVETPQAPKSPLQERAFNTNSRQDFINSEIANQTKAKEINTAVSMFQKGRKVITEIPKDTPKQLGKIWDEAHASPKQPATPTIPRQVIDQPTTQPLNSQESVLQGKAQMETPSVKTTPGVDAQGFRKVEPGEVLPNGYTTKMNQTTGETLTNAPYKDTPSVPKTPDFEAKVADGAEVLRKSAPESVEGGNHETYSRLVNEDLVANPEKAKRIALGQETPTNGVPSDAYYSIVANQAEKNGDINLLKEMSRPGSVASSSGTKLEANKLRTKGGILDDMRDIRKARAEQLGVSDTKYTKEQNTLLSSLKEKIKNFSEVTKQEVDEIMNSLICK